MQIYLEVQNPKEKNKMLQFLRNINEYHRSCEENMEKWRDHKINK